MGKTRCYGGKGKQPKRSLKKAFFSYVRKAKELRKKGGIRNLIESYNQCLETLESFSVYSYGTNLEGPYRRVEEETRKLCRRIVLEDLKGKSIEVHFRKSLEEVLSRPNESYKDPEVLEDRVLIRLLPKLQSDFYKTDTLISRFREENKSVYIWSLKQELKKKKNARLRKSVQEKAEHMDEIIEANPFRTSISLGVRDDVMRRTGWRCFYCGRNNKLEVDHILPFSRGGRNAPSNLVAACRECNYEKSDEVLVGADSKRIDSYDLLLKYCASVKPKAALKGSGVKCGRPTFGMLLKAGFKCQNSSCRKAAHRGARLFLCEHRQARGRIVLCERCSTEAKSLDEYV